MNGCWLLEHLANLADSTLKCVAHSIVSDAICYTHLTRASLIDISVNFCIVAYKPGLYGNKQTISGTQGCPPVRYRDESVAQVIASILCISEFPQTQARRNVGYAAGY